MDLECYGCQSPLCFATQKDRNENIQNALSMAEWNKLIDIICQQIRRCITKFLSFISRSGRRMLSAWDVTSLTSPRIEVFHPAINQELFPASVLLQFLKVICSFRQSLINFPPGNLSCNCLASVSLRTTRTCSIGWKCIQLIIFNILSSERFYGVQNCNYITER